MRKFTLTLEIQGGSLDEIDQELMQAAGERLVSRMKNPPAGGVAGMMKTPPPNVATSGYCATVAPTSSNVGPPVATVLSTATPAAPEPPKARRGVKPGTKRGTYKRTKEEDTHEVPENGSTKEENEDQSAPDDHNSSAPEVDGEGDQGLQSPAPAPHPRAPASQAPAEAAEAAPATLVDVVEALKLVNLKLNADKARDCLASFNVKRCGELSQEQRRPFISHCEALVGGQG